MESFDTFLILDTQSNIGTTTECILKRCVEPKTRTQLKASEMSEKYVRNVSTNRNTD